MCILKSTHRLFIAVIMIITLVFCAFSVSSWINIVCIATMLIVIMVNYFSGLRHSIEIYSDFQSVSDKLKDKDNTVDIEDIYFTNSAMQSAYRNYCSESKRNRKFQNSVGVDVSDYINCELLDSILKREFSEQISGAMTGFGILGTFVGLTIGLNGFRLGSGIGTDEMMINISGLMEGIKTSFLTSIYGIVFSLVVNQFYKHFYCRTVDSMNEFYSDFEELSSSPQNDFITEIICGQNKQNELIGNLADEISVAMVNHINDTLKPTFDYFNKSIDTFIDKSVMTHNESLEAIVDSFITNMNNSLGDQFTELGATLRELNSSQLSNTAKLQEIVDDICTTAVDIKSINELLDNAIAKMSGYVEKIDSFQNNLNIANERMFAQLQTLNEFSVKQTVVLDQMSKQQEKIAAASENLFGLVEKSQTASESLLKASVDVANNTQTIISENTATLLEMTQKILNDIVVEVRTAIESINYSSAEQNKTICDSFESAVNESKKILESQMQEANKISEQMEINMKRSAAAINEAYNNLDNNLVSTLERVFHSFDQQLADIESHLAGTIENSKNTIGKMDEYIQDVPEKLYTVIKNLIHEMEEITQRIAQ